MYLLCEDVNKLKINVVNPSIHASCIVNDSHLYVHVKFVGGLNPIKMKDKETLTLMIF